MAHSTRVAYSISVVEDDPGIASDLGMALTGAGIDAGLVEMLRCSLQS